LKNTGPTAFIIVDEQIIETGTGNDGSHEYAIDGGNYFSDPNTWESTFMDYWLTGGSCMHAYSLVEDQYGARVTTNTITACR